MTPIVVGVCHDRKLGLLLNTHARKRFGEEILPLVNKDTLLILEGGYQRKVYSPADKKYRRVRNVAERFLGITLPESPLIAWRDPRMFPFHRAAIASVILDDALEKILCGIPQPNLSCRSLAVLLRRVDRGIVPHISRKKDLSYRQKLVLWNNAREMREFDRCVVATTKKYEDTHRVILVCGITHALAITRAQGWELRPLIKNTKKELLHAIRTYHVSYVLPPYFPLNLR